MTSEILKYESGEKRTSSLEEISLEKGSQDGLNWECTFFVDSSFSSGKLEKTVFLKWKFDWDQLEEQGVEGFVGEITALCYTGKGPSSIRFNIKVVCSVQWICKRIGTVGETRHSNSETRFFIYNFSLKKIFSLPDDSFPHDAVLVVEEKKIEVNKAHLSMFSTFFNTLFNSDFKEKSMAEIPIEDVKYDDFQRLLEVIHPKRPTQVTYSDAEMLLELADRFMIPAVTAQVENYLYLNPDVPFFGVFKLADKFKLQELFDWCFSQFTSIDELKLLGVCPPDFEFPDALRIKLFNKFLEFAKK